MSRFPEYRTDSTWITGRRGEKQEVDPWFPQGYFCEQERMASGRVESVNTLLLTSRECPFRCLMCDLWQHTSDEVLPEGAIPSQIAYALERLPSADHLKLYNSGSFFDPKAVLPRDYSGIAEAVEGYRTVLVESHTAFIGRRVLDFAELLQAELQVAIGLETVHPEVLPRLNKKMSLDDFSRAVDFLGSQHISTRAFILLRPPFLSEEEGVEWACRSIDFAFDQGVECCSLIPVRSGNGALDQLASEAFFHEPRIPSLEQVLEYGIGLNRGRVFADLWDLDRFANCPLCLDRRKERLEAMNLKQEVPPPVNCSCSGE